MRPKRICLCVGTDAAALGVLVFMLRTKGYAVLEAATAEAALSVAGQNDFDLLICFNGIDGQTGDGLICKVKELYPEKPAILIRQTAEASDTCSANAQVVQPWNAMELLERVKVMTARKRGPRPGPAAPAAALRTYAQGLGTRDWPRSARAGGMMTVDGEAEREVVKCLNPRCGLNQFMTRNEICRRPGCGRPLKPEPLLALVEAGEQAEPVTAAVKRPRRTRAEVWADPEFRRRRAEAMREVANRPEVKLRKAEAMRKRWADPEFRRRKAEAMRKRWAERKKNANTL